MMKTLPITVTSWGLVWEKSQINAYDWRCTIHGVEYSYRRENLSWNMYKGDGSGFWAQLSLSRGPEFSHGFDGVVQALIQFLGSAPSETPKKKIPRRIDGTWNF